MRVPATVTASGPCFHASKLSATSADLVFYTSDARTDQFFKRF